MSFCTFCSFCLGTTLFNPCWLHCRCPSWPVVHSPTPIMWSVSDVRKNMQRDEQHPTVVDQAFSACVGGRPDVRVSLATWHLMFCLTSDIFLSIGQRLPQLWITPHKHMMVVLTNSEVIQLFKARSLAREYPLLWSWEELSQRKWDCPYMTSVGINFTNCFEVTPV